MAKGGLSRLFKGIFVLVKALESSIAERLHDLARNSMDSVGVSGGGAVDKGSQLGGPFSSIFSSLCEVPFAQHELTNTTTLLISGYCPKNSSKE